MKYPADCKYTKDHEWVRVEGDTVVVGITDFAQSELGEIVFIELPEIGRSAAQGETLCVVESTKAASDVYAPVGGTVKEVNEALADDPALINNSPQDDGWMVRLSGVSEAELSALMDNEEYEELTKE